MATDCFSWIWQNSTQVGFFSVSSSVYSLNRSAGTIEHLRQAYTTSSDITLYFFCDHRSQQKQILMRLLMSLARQLATRSVTCYQHARQLHPLLCLARSQLFRSLSTTWVCKVPDGNSHVLRLSSCGCRFWSRSVTAVACAVSPR